jgi:DNA-binding protein YbaB
MIFGKFGDLAKRAQELQQNLKKIKAELKTLKYTGENNVATVVVNGEMEVIDIRILKRDVSPEELEKQIKDAANSALVKARDEAAQKLKKAAGGFNIPGIGS